LKDGQGPNPDGYLVNSKLGQKCVYVNWLGYGDLQLRYLVDDYQNRISFDGLWTTMNEAYADIPGEIY
jgi:hypothetical protein